MEFSLSGLDDEIPVFQGQTEIISKFTRPDQT